MFPLRDNIPSKGFPFVNYLLIIVNIFVFVKEIQLARVGALEAFIFKEGLVPQVFLTAPVTHISNLFTHMFLHGGWGHVLGNMWFLHIFGDNVEERLGHVRYFIYYLLMGLGAAAAQMYMHPGATMPMIGASGAIAGVLGGYFILFPGARVLTFFIFVIFIKFIEIPAFFFLGLWFLMQAFNGVGSIATQAVRGDTGGVAWWAHAGGFAAGILFINFFRRSLPSRQIAPLFGELPSQYLSTAGNLETVPNQSLFQSKSSA